MTDDGLEGSVVVTVTPYFDVDGNGAIDADDDCDGTPVTLTINVDPIPVVSAMANGQLVNGTTDPMVQLCDEETLTITSLMYGTADASTLLNVNFAYTNVDAASFAPEGDNTFTGTAFRSGFEGNDICLLYTSPSPRDATLSRMPSSA